MSHIKQQLHVPAGQTSAQCTALLSGAGSSIWSEMVTSTSCVFITIVIISHVLQAFVGTSLVTVTTR